jgi:hypothetical protein
MAAEYKALVEKWHAATTDEERNGIAAQIDALFDKEIDEADRDKIKNWVYYDKDRNSYDLNSILPNKITYKDLLQ